MSTAAEDKIASNRLIRSSDPNQPTTPKQKLKHCDPRFVKKHFTRFIKAHAVDMLITVALGIGTLLMYLFWSPRHRFFIERDPAISYPIVNATLSDGRHTIPIWLIIVLTLPVIFAILIAVRIVATLVFHISKHTHQVHPRALNLWVLLLAYTEAFILNLFVTTFIHRFVSKKRPNFFAVCNYHGYNDALQSNNYTTYESLTVPGRPGNLSNCLSPEDDVNDAMLAFPSGHASMIICAGTFVALYTYYIFNIYSPKQSMLKGILLLVILLGSIVAACTRITDHWHATDDVLAGACIGFASATFVYYLYYHSEVAVANLPGPREDPVATPDGASGPNDVEMGKVN